MAQWDDVMVYNYLFKSTSYLLVHFHYFILSLYNYLPIKKSMRKDLRLFFFRIQSVNRHLQLCVYVCVCLHTCCPRQTYNFKNNDVHSPLSSLWYIWLASYVLMNQDWIPLVIHYCSYLVICFNPNFFTLLPWYVTRWAHWALIKTLLKCGVLYMSPLGCIGIQVKEM